MLHKRRLLHVAWKMLIDLQTRIEIYVFQMFDKSIKYIFLSTGNN